MISNKDLEIICHLRNDGRAQLKEISKLTNIPISTIFDRMKLYQGSLIQRHTTLIDFSKLGFNARASMLISVEKEDKNKVKDFLKFHPNANSVFKINNGFDYLFDGLFSTVNDMEEFIASLESKFKIKDIKFYYIIEEVRKEAFLSSKELANLVSKKINFNI